jgi:hypothetical protein
LRDGAVERSLALASLGGAEIMEPSEFPVEASDLAVLVKSPGEPSTVLGCWSAASEEAHRLMSDIFQLSHGLPL